MKIIQIKVFYKIMMALGYSPCMTESPLLIIYPRPNFNESSVKLQIVFGIGEW